MNTVLEIKNVTQYFGGLTALDDINIHIDEGEVVGIIGPNGAGKSTLFNVVTGIYAPASGKVFLSGSDITGYKPYKITQMGFARTFQNIRIFPKMTVLENILMGMHCRRSTNLFEIILHTNKVKAEEKKCLERAYELLHLLGLYNNRYDLPASLPYGAQRKLEITRALATEPKLLLLDEPAAGMNEQETAELLGIVKILQKSGYTIWLIEHDMKFVMNVCERIYVLNHGQMIAHGTPEQIRTNPAVIEAYLGKEENE